MKYNGHPLRHELKYMISYTEYYSLASSVGAVMPCDENSRDGGYFIRSLYFDDIYNSAYNEKQAGVFRRRKWRIRTYNLTDDVIKFEIKDKYDNCISKMSAGITAEQCRQIMSGNYDFMLSSDKQALRAGFIDARLKQLHPRVIVDYYREAYVCEEGNVRVTFDSDLRAGVGSLDIFDRGLLTMPAMQEGTMILEVKYDDFLPQTVRKLLAPLDRRQLSLSKFSMCCDIQNTYYRKEMPHVII